MGTEAKNKAQGPAGTAGPPKDSPGTGEPPKAGPPSIFAHLHLHTEYSLLDGGNQVEKLVARVAELGMTSCAITDHGNLFGCAHFYSACKEKGIKPILGCEAYVTPPGKPRTDRTYSGGGEGGYHLVLLAENNTGWQNLMVLGSEAYLTGFYYKPRIDRELLEKHSEGLIAINGHLGSEIGDHLLAYHRSGDEKYWNAAVESAAWHKRVFGGDRKTVGTPVPPGGYSARFFIELQHHVPEQNAINPLLIKLARELGLPLVCDNDAHFLKAEDHEAHDTLICISTGKGKSDPDRMRYTPELYVKSPQQMAEVFEEYGEAGREALENAAAIAERCKVELPMGANNSPAVQIDLPDAKALPKWDDPAFAGDLTAWYKAYCSKFELRPFSSAPTPAQIAESKRACDQALRMLSEAGFVWRYGPGASATLGTPTLRVGNEKPHAERGGTQTQESAQESERRARLERELKILADKNISAYFLIVWDFVNWGRQRGIPANARGSGVGTMVGYVLGLSNACPVQYGLLFERFTDPDRSEYPDIDIDLCQDGRSDVIDYVRKKYGHVAQIITFGTLKARAAIRDVGRVLEMTIPEVDRIAKLVPEQLNITIEEALEKEPELKKSYDSDDRVRQLLDNAIQLEGHTRHAGVHAAGVIVATRPLQEIVPLYKAPGSEGNDIVTQWDGPTCEKMGLLKMDFLGLRTLSTIERAKKLIVEGLPEEEIWRAVGKERPKGQMANGQMANQEAGDTGSSFDPLATCDLALSPHPLDLDRLDYADPRVFELFQRADTTGVFQFESGGMRRLLVEMKPDRIEDLIAANALFRPGPMDLIPDYNKRKHGQADVPKVHRIVDEYTRETYGVMVYQEQVMQIVHGLGEIKLRDAYSLIKNISKKKHDKIEKERPKFVEGAHKQGLSKQQAEDLFELILKFAGYGFNKSHSTGYAIVAYQTAYLKTYFPNQYMAAFLSFESQANKASEWIPYLEDARRCRFLDASVPPPQPAKIIKVGVEVRPPDINLSQADFAVVFEEGEPRTAAGGHVRFGLKAIKGAGEKAIEAVLKERDGETERRRDEVSEEKDEETTRQRDGVRKAEDIATAPSSLRLSVSSSLRLSPSKPFTSLFDFCERIPTQSVNKATIESLIRCGAFDSVHGRPARAAMMATIEQAISAGSRAASDRASGQGGLFMLGGGPASKAPAPQPVLARAEPWNEAETLAKEKETLGFYVSSHPLERWKTWSQAFATHTTSAVKECKQDQRVVVAAMIQSVRAIVVKNGRSAGQKMGILTIEDLSGAMDAVLFTDQFAKYGHLAAGEAVLFVMGRVDMSRGDPQIIVDRLVPIEGVPFDSGKIRLFVDEMKLNGGSQTAMRGLAEAVRVGGTPQPGAAAKSIQAIAEGKLSFPVEIVIGTEDQVAILAADAKMRVSPTPEFFKAVETHLGAGMVRVVGVTKEEPAKNEKRWARKSED